MLTRTCYCFDADTHYAAAITLLRACCHVDIPLLRCYAAMPADIDARGDDLLRCMPLEIMVDGARYAYAAMRTAADFRLSLSLHTPMITPLTLTLLIYEIITPPL